MAMLVRDPWSFFVSWWYYIGAKRCGFCRFREFLGLNPNAQAHMAIGGAARKYSEPLRRRHLERDPALKSALRSMLRGVDLLGPTERVSPCPRVYGEPCDPKSSSARLLTAGSVDSHRVCPETSSTSSCLRSVRRAVYARAHARAR